MRKGARFLFSSSRSFAAVLAFSSVLKVAPFGPETVEPQVVNQAIGGQSETCNSRMREEGRHQFSNPLHDAWIEFLSTQDWQWFVTFTFKSEIHPEAADKIYRVWINKLNREIYGQRWRKRPPYGVKHVRALEWQKRGVLHYHALIANVAYQDRTHWARVWEKLGDDSKAGFIKIDLYDHSRGGVEAYLAKYVTKGGQIDVSANFKAIPSIPQYPVHAPTTNEIFG